MSKGGQRTAAGAGAMLADPAILGNAPSRDAYALFDPLFWQQRGESTAVSAGRGSAWFVGREDSQWALRHYRRGGWVAALTQDHYLWLGENRVRSFAEWRLLDVLASRGLPVPQPIAAGYQRHGVSYRCDLLTARIMGAIPLSQQLTIEVPAAGVWRELGAVIRRFHDAGVDHADLNAHNILLDAAGRITLIDFDRGRLRGDGAWKRANLDRLHRSLSKITRGAPERFAAQSWTHLMAGYQHASAAR